MKTRSIKMFKWNFLFALVPHRARGEGYEFHLGFFKPTSCPFEGEMWSEEHFKGWWIRKSFNPQGFFIQL